MGSIKFDTSDFEKGLNRLQQAVNQKSRAGLMHVGDEVMRLSGFEVPHDKGDLQSSASIDVISDTEVQVGYNKEYAAHLHEHPEYNFQKGRKGKYLVDPIVNNLKQFKSYLQKVITSL